MADDGSSAIIADANIRRAIFVERWGEQLAARMAEVISIVMTDVIAQIQTTEFGSYERARLESLIADLQQIADGIDEQLLAEFQPALAELTQANIDSQSGTLATAGVTLSAESLSAEQILIAALADPVQGRTLNEWLKGIEDDVKQNISDIVRIAWVEGLTTSEIVEMLTQISDKSVRDLTAITRTMITHLNNQVLIETYSGSPDIAEKYIWLSILDRRTTPICRARSNRTYKIGHGPLPPAHFQCRSAIAPILKGLPNPKFTSYDDWLRKQPKPVVQDILGDDRAKLFFDGGLKMDQFVNEKTGKYYTLAELAEREKSAWRKAGLD